MPGLSIYMSNRTELLADRLAALLAESPPAGVMSPEIVVVQSKGMQRWLSTVLARANGICANVDFPFPNAFLTDMVSRLVPDLSARTDNDLLALTFRLMQRLPDFLATDGFQRLRGYLNDDPRQLKLFQLSRRIAFLFDQYTVYRPSLLARWEEAGPEDDSDGRWQARLWQTLVRESEPAQRLQWPRQLAAALERGAPAAAGLPSRAALFGISYLPPLHFHLLAELSRVMQLNVFWLNPCRHYWGDILSEKRAQRLQLRSGRPREDLHLERGHRLLSAFGALGRDFMEMILGYDCAIVETFACPKENTTLGRLQAGILEMRADPRGPAADPAALSAGNPGREKGNDRSIQVHSCHSPLREIEVLYDNILAALEADPQMSPGDVIVMAPDIQLYAPYIDAVFGGQTEERLRLPYSIADRSARSTSGVVDGFMALLEIKDSRFGAARILRLLEYPAIRERFGLNPADLPRIEAWVRDAQIRWGIDRHSLRREGLPDFDEHTWEAGFRRMLLGYALPTDESELFEGILPYDHIEGTDSVVLGNLIDFVRRLEDLSMDLSGPKSVSLWQAVLLEKVTDFVESDAAGQRDLQSLRQAVARLAEAAAAARFTGAVDLSVIVALLREQLEASGSTAGFLGQGITFCALLPMRSIPFDMICLVGMDHGAFPRDSQPLNFDLMVRYPQPGDRSRRKDDKYLFLEAVLSARKVLCISYVGQNVQDNSVIPPSVLVRELLESLDPRAGTDASSGVQVTVQHRLQPFAGDYFKGDPRLFSYSRQNLQLAVHAGEQREPPPFFEAPLDLTPGEAHWGRQLDLERLAGFMGHPARYLLNRRLGLFLETGAAAAEDCERFFLTGLERYLLGERMAARRMERGEPFDQWLLLKASGSLPPGNTGRTAYEQLTKEVDAFLQRLAGIGRRPEPIRLDIDFVHEELTLRGTVPQACRGGCLTARFARTKARDLLRTWIYHLGYAVAAPEATPPVSYLVCRDSAWQFDPVPGARTHLENLLALFRSGMAGPIAFFPQTSYVFADRLMNRGRSENSAVNTARRAWMGSEFAAGEAEDPYMALCFHQRDPLDESFRALAVKVFQPLFAHLQPVAPVVQPLS